MQKSDNFVESGNFKLQSEPEVDIPMKDGKINANRVSGSTVLSTDPDQLLQAATDDEVSYKIKI